GGVHHRALLGPRRAAGRRHARVPGRASALAGVAGVALRAGLRRRGALRRGVRGAALATAGLGAGRRRFAGRGAPRGSAARNAGMKAQEHEVSTMRSGSEPAGPAGDVREYNRAAWDRQVARGNRWTVPVTSEAIARARAGEWEIVLTPARPAPRAWFGVRRESVRVLRPGGALLAGLTNPLVYLFDDALAQQGELRVRHVLPYADETHLTAAELAAVRAADEPFCFSHSLEQQIGGQLEAG